MIEVVNSTMIVLVLLKKASTSTSLSTNIYF